MGWKKLRDDDDLCRVLDGVLDGVEALKSAVRKGERFEGRDGLRINAREIWCPESRPSTSNESALNLKDAKGAITKMKEMKTSLVSMLESLDEAINDVTDMIALDCRATGLASLPDEVLAQIFELCHICGPFYSGARQDTAGDLASVCRRFRRIAIHLPALWKDVSWETPANRLSSHAERSRKSRVYLHKSNLTNATDGFLEQIRPSHDWEELHLHFADAFSGRELFRTLSPWIQTPLDSLQYLSISNECRSEQDEEVDFHEAEDAMEDVDEYVASWQYPNLTRIKLENIFPSILMSMDCPNVTHVELLIQSYVNIVPGWDAECLSEFLQSMPKLDSLTLRFTGPIYDSDDSDLQRMVLPCLRSLDITLSKDTDLKVVCQFMETMETEMLTKLRVCVEQAELDPGLQDNRAYSDSSTEAWERVVFARPEDERYFGFRVRPFSAVEDFSLNITASPNVRQPQLAAMFMALPNVKDISLQLPEFMEINLAMWMEGWRGLRELRSLRISVLGSWFHPGHVKFFEMFSKSERWDNFESLEVITSSKELFRAERSVLEEIVGEKLLWTKARS